MTQKSYAFYYGQRFLVENLSPIGVSRTRSSVLKIYSTGPNDQAKLVYTYAPRLALPGGFGMAGARQLIPDVVDIHIVKVRDFTGSGGTQVLLNLFDPQEPYFAVIPLLLSEVQPSHPTAQIRFTVQPLLSPQTISGVPMARLLTTRLFRANDWASVVRSVLYADPVEITQIIGHAKPALTYAVAAYRYRMISTPLQQGGLMELAAGYTVRGGDYPSPVKLQVLNWTINLSGNSPSARTTANVPLDLLCFDPSSTPARVSAALQRDLKHVADGYPATNGC